MYSRMTVRQCVRDCSGKPAEAFVPGFVADLQRKARPERSKAE